MLLSLAVIRGWTVVLDKRPAIGCLCYTQSAFIILKVHSCSVIVSTFFITAHLFSIGNVFLFSAWVFFAEAV